MAIKQRTFIAISSIGVFALGAMPAFADTLRNPLGDGVVNPDVVIANVIKVFLGVVGVIALVYFIYGGFTMMISAGNAEKLKKGRDTLFWAIIGLAVIFGSYGLTEAVFQALSGQSIT